MAENQFVYAGKLSAVAERSNATVGKVSGIAESPNEQVGLFSAAAEHLQELFLFWEFDGKVLFERFKKRSESGERHPGHVDHNNYTEFEEQLLSGQSERLDIESEIIEIDTTDFSNASFMRGYMLITYQS